MKYKKFLMGLLSFACVAASALGLAACGNGTNNGVDGGESTSQTQGTAGLHYQRIAGKDEYRVIGLGLAAELDIVIPAAYNGLPVTEIGEMAFSGETYITSVVIPDSVTTIGASAFIGCNGLTSVTIGDSVTTIGDAAFARCNSLKSVTIPDGVMTIGYDTFYDCDGLMSMMLPDSVTMIGERAFSNCSSLTSVTIPDSVTMIGDKAFSNCSSLTSVTIGNSVTVIGVHAFVNCSDLTCIEYKGKTAEWELIYKGPYWNLRAGITKVVCSDGEVEL